ncbi:TetR/AcrR family transcriptional regulator [Micromonospora sp. DT31]|uniref:TetR/AcrR family transcriptional regulator n=1 Tax=Micromonospora sp. DT31 TaxID=3393434 RepID=UPI003CFB5BA0
MTDTDRGRPGLRDRKKRRTRAALSEAALRLVAERGLDQVTVEEISEAVEVSARTFFNYFASKDEALLGDPAAEAELLTRRILAAPPDLSAFDAVRSAFDDVVAAIEADREVWRLRLTVIAANPSLLPRLVSGNAATERLLVAAVAQRLGLDPCHGHPMLVTTVAGAVFRTALMRWAEEPAPAPLRELVAEAFTAVAAGLPDPRATR